MKLELKRELLDYFELKENRDEIEEHLYKQLKSEIGNFDIASFGDFDIEVLGYDPNSLTEGEKNAITIRMNDNYTSSGMFWDDLGYYLDELNAEKLNNK